MYIFLINLIMNSEYELSLKVKFHIFEHIHWSELLCGIIMRPTTQVGVIFDDAKHSVINQIILFVSSILNLDGFFYDISLHFLASENCHKQAY